MTNQLTQQEKKAQTVALAVKNLGYPITSQDENKVTFYYKKSIVTFYVDTEQVTGYTIKSGRGLMHLLQQIKHG